MSLADLRKEIDAIDDILVQAFADRMDLVAQVAEEKKKIDKPVLDKGRERDKLADIASKLPPELEQYGYTLWNMLFEISRSYQSSLKQEPSSLRVEIQQAMDAGLQVCTLGKRILRCETAPLCALSAVMFATGEF